MRFSSIVACLFLATAAMVPFKPWAPKRISSSAFEVQVASDHSGLVQLYFQLGPHMIEEDSAIQPIVAGHPALLRFALPYGTIKVLRFDPLDKEAHMTLADARIVDGSGRVMVSFPPGRFRPMNQIRLLEARDGKLYVETQPGGTDPQLWVNLAAPLAIPRSFWGWGIATLFAVLVGCLLAIEWARRATGGPLPQSSAATGSRSNPRPGSRATWAPAGSCRPRTTG